MCDYSLHSIKSRTARVGEQLTTRDFGTGTRGFAAAEDANVAVCLKPGTELAFAGDVECMRGLFFWRQKLIKHRTAIFCQINLDNVWVHHDALEFPDGKVVLLTSLREGQHARVLQLPVEARAPVVEPILRWQSLTAI